MGTAQVNNIVQIGGAIGGQSSGVTSMQNGAVDTVANLKNWITISAGGITTNQYTGFYRYGGTTPTTAYSVPAGFTFCAPGLWVLTSSTKGDVCILGTTTAAQAYNNASAGTGYLAYGPASPSALDALVVTGTVNEYLWLPMPIQFAQNLFPNFHPVTTGGMHAIIPGVLIPG